MPEGQGRGPEARGGDPGSAAAQQQTRAAPGTRPVEGSSARPDMRRPQTGAPPPPRKEQLPQPGAEQPFTAAASRALPLPVSVSPKAEVAGTGLAGLERSFCRRGTTDTLCHPAVEKKSWFPSTGIKTRERPITACRMKLQQGCVLGAGFRCGGRGWCPAGWRPSYTGSGTRWRVRDDGYSTSPDPCL